MIVGIAGDLAEPFAFFTGLVCSAGLSGNIIGSRSGAVATQSRQPFRGHKLGDGEVAGNDDAQAAEHERGVEHGGGKGGAITQLGEVVVVPVGVVGGQARHAHAGDDKERE